MAADFKIERDWLFENLLGKLNSHTHLVLTADQGWGIKEYVNELGFHLTERNPDIQSCYIDMKSTHSSASFLDLFVAALANRFPEEAASIKISSQSIDSLKLPSIIAQRKNIRIAVFLANSHLLHRFRDSIPFLRTMKLKLKNQKKCIFCFYGDIHTNFRDLIRYPGPLSGLGHIYELRHNPTNHRSASIRKLFHDHNKSISYQTSVELSYAVDNHPFYLKLLTWHALIKTSHSCTTDIIQEAINDLIFHYDHQFNMVLESLTQKQISFLKAMAEGKQRLYSQATRKKYRLGSSSNVARIKHSLEKKNFINDVKLTSDFSDPIFKQWLRKRYFNRSYAADL